MLASRDNAFILSENLASLRNQLDKERESHNLSKLQLSAEVESGRAHLLQLEQSLKVYKNDLKSYTSVSEQAAHEYTQTVDDLKKQVNAMMLLL